MAALSLCKLGRQLTFAPRRLFSGASGKVRLSIQLVHLNVPLIILICGLLDRSDPDVFVLHSQCTTPGSPCGDILKPSGRWHINLLVAINFHSP